MSKVSVIFRKWSDGTVDAIMPYEVDFNYLVTCYSKIGQHSQADYDYVISKTKPAKEDEYRSLLNELKNIGYEVSIIKRVNKSKILTLQHELNQSR